MIDIRITNEIADINIAHEKSFDVLERLISTTAEVLIMCKIPLNVYAKVLLQYNEHLKNKED